MVPGKDNTLLVEFDFLVDLDLAMFKYIRNNFYESEYVNHKLLSLRNEKQVIHELLYREHINPLEILIPGEDTTNIYYSLLNDKYIELLKYSSMYDTFGLMITFLKEASSVSIDVLCKNELESKFIKAFNNDLSTVVFKTKREINLTPYTALYIKYFVNITGYNNVRGKHIYIPAARYNMQDGEDVVDVNMLKLYGDVNEVHLIDLYKDVKFRFNRKDNKEDADIF